MKVHVIMNKHSRIDDYRILEALDENLSFSFVEEIVFQSNPSSVRATFGDASVIINRIQSGRMRYIVTQCLEECGYKVINSSKIQQYSRNKFLTYLKLSSAGISTPITLFPSYTRVCDEDSKVIFYRKSIDNASKRIIDAVGLPLIEKPVDGTHGIGVRRIEKMEELKESLINRNPRNLSLFQQFCDAAWEIRSVSVKAPNEEPKLLACVAKCASDKKQKTRNLAVSGVPVYIPNTNAVKQIETKLIRALLSKSEDYAILGNDWTPIGTEERETEKIYENARNLLPLQKEIRASRGSLTQIYRAAFYVRDKILNLQSKLDEHNKLIEKYKKSKYHQTIQSLILERLDDGPNLVFLDMNDNQDFPNVYDLSEAPIPQHYKELALRVSKL